jgi:hypothetical protein
MGYFSEDNPKIIIKECKWTLFELGKIGFCCIIFQEPYKTDDITKNNLEKYTSNMNNFCDNLFCIGGRGDDIDKITNLRGYILPLSERAL